MRSVPSKEHKSKRKSPNAQQIITTEEKIVRKIIRNPSTPSKNYLEDEIWDILPKTDYTYARSGSYSPRFFGRKYVNPNMSRYRIRSSRRSYDGSYEDDVDGDFDEYDYSDSDMTTETVIEDGMELRSGKNLFHLKQMQLENERQQEQNNVVANVNHSAKSRSEKKLQKSYQNQKQYSKSERRRYSASDSSSLTSFLTDYSNVHARRRLENNFEGNSSYSGNNYENQGVSLRSSNRGRYSRNKQDIDDSRHSGYMVKTVTTVTEEFEDIDTNGGLEKGAIETSEKQSTSGEQNYSKGQYVHLDGLDGDDFSDQESASYYRGRHNYGNGSRYDDNVSTTTTVVTTITETVTSLSRSVVSPVWNTVGRPVVTHVVQPTWTHIVQPAVSILTSVLTSVLILTWSALSWPVSMVVTTVQTVSEFLMSTGVGGMVKAVGSAAKTMWQSVEHVMMNIVLLDVWLFKRRRGRGCCLCLPLLLLLPLLLALYAGRDAWDMSAVSSNIWSAKSVVVGMFNKESVPPPVLNTENREYLTHLNQLILQLQSDSQGHLTAADVEGIVYRILNKETASLKADLEGSNYQQQQIQLQWKTEQEARLGDMKIKHDELIMLIKNLEDTIANQKAFIVTQGDSVKADALAYMANLEEKLAALHAELHDLETKHEALLLRVNACCQNESYYAAAIKDNVNIILAQMMAGHMSGNPNQDAFTDWLHSNYVSRETLDKRLKELADDLTGKVIAMVTEVQKSQADAQLSQQQQGQEQQMQGAIYGVGEQQVRLMIEQALFKYSADKTGLADFALESAGGTVISTRCSDTFEKKTALIKIFGLPLWYVSNSPRTVLQPEVHPGQCWAFKGPTGYIVIQTSTVITPSGFTLEHIPKSLAPSGEIDSAPKDFMVLGLQDEYDDNGQWLGNFTYNDNDNPVQFFPAVLQGERTVFNLFELRILNNYGNPQYTCLYRFRIHGKPYRP